MITISKQSIKDIPVLMLSQTKNIKEALPTVVYYHGFNGEKESSLTIAYKIVEKGYRVILPDSIYHGERRQNITQSEMDIAFWEIVMQNITELHYIKDYLEENKLLLHGAIGIGGTSMGGITTYGALNTYDWIKAAAVLMGTPKITAYANRLIDRFNQANERKITDEESNNTLPRLEEIDISLQTEKLNNRPLFIWHGEKDAIIPVQYSKDFYETVQNEYKVKENIKCIIEKDRIHNISRLSIEETANWFQKHLLF